ARDCVLRCKGKTSPDGDCLLVARADLRAPAYYFAYFHSDGGFGIGRWKNYTLTMLAENHFPYAGEDFVDMAFIVEGTKLTAVVRQPWGVRAAQAEDGDLSDGAVGVGNSRGVGWFKDVEVQVLDK